MKKSEINKISRHAFLDKCFELRASGKTFDQIAEICYSSRSLVGKICLANNDKILELKRNEYFKQVNNILSSQEDFINKIVNLLMVEFSERIESKGKRPFK